jgi:hypothetical protein
MNDVQKLAEILEILLLQELAKVKENSAASLVYKEAVKTCSQIKKGE